MELLAALPIDVESASLAQALGSITDVARANQLSAYDAAYLDLARRLALPLATLDRHLAAVAVQLGVEVIGQPQ